MHQNLGYVACSVCRVHAFARDKMYPWLGCRFCDVDADELHVWVFALVGVLAVLGGTYAVDLLDILLGWCSGLCLIWIHPSVSCW